MTDAPRAGPPEKRARRPASAKVSAALVRDVEELDAWCKHARIPKVPVSPSRQLEELVAAGAPVWIASNIWSGSDIEQDFAIQHATCVLSAVDLDDVCTEADPPPPKWSTLLYSGHIGQLPFGWSTSIAELVVPWSSCFSPRSGSCRLMMESEGEGGAI